MYSTVINSDQKLGFDHKAQPLDLMLFSSLHLEGHDEW